MSSFKERVRNECITHAKEYFFVFIQYEYLVCSKAFESGYYIIKADKGNYLHLTGVHTAFTAEQFFDKCYNEELKEEDFDFVKPGRGDKSVKGAVRDKIKTMPYMMNMFHVSLYAEDNFKKNRVKCAFATTDHNCTLGFVKEGRPQSLLRGNELNKERMRKVDLVFRKPRGASGKFGELIYGNEAVIEIYKNLIGIVINERYMFSDRSKYNIQRKIDNCANHKEKNCKIKKPKNFIPICFRDNTYIEKLKNIKRKNCLR